MQSTHNSNCIGLHNTENKSSIVILQNLHGVLQRDGLRHKSQYHFKKQHANEEDISSVHFVAHLTSVIDTQVVHPSLI